MKLSPDTEIKWTLIGFRIKVRAYMDTDLYLYWAGWPWPLTTEKQEASSSHHVDQLYQVVRSWTNGSVFILPTMYPATFSTYVTLTFDLRPWKNIMHLFLTILINCSRLYDPGAYIFLLSDNTTLTFDLQPCKTIGIFSHHADQMYGIVRYWS